MPNVHPIIVHFPIAILALALLFDLMGLYTHSDAMERAGWWSQVAGTVCLVAAVISGLIGRGGVLIPAAAQGTFDTHQQIAFVAATGSGFLLLWRMANRTRLPGRYPALFLWLMASIVVIIWVGSYYGGELVFRFGVGVR